MPDTMVYAVWHLADTMYLVPTNHELRGPFKRFCPCQYNIECRAHKTQLLRFIEFFINHAVLADTELFEFLKICQALKIQ